MSCEVSVLNIPYKYLWISLRRVWLVDKPMYKNRSKRRQIAESISHGKLVAAKMTTYEGVVCRWSRNYVFSRRASSLSPDAPRAPHNASISSKNKTHCLSWAACMKTYRSCFSLLPTHLLKISTEEKCKKGMFSSHAVARAISVLPVPGGPYNKMRRHGWRLWWKNAGKRRGIIVACLIAAIASSHPFTSAHRTRYYTSENVCASLAQLTLPDLHLPGQCTCCSLYVNVLHKFVCTLTFESIYSDYRCAEVH